MKSLQNPAGSKVPATYLAGADLLPEQGRLDELLEPIFASQPFRNSQQCQRLLGYIVEHSLAHEEHLLRERVIGSVVFGRRPDYETGEDPVVRIRAAEVRKRLAQYYQSFSALDEMPDVRIEIPPGSYRATFRSQTAEKSATKLPPGSSHENLRDLDSLEGGAASGHSSESAQSPDSAAVPKAEPDTKIDFVTGTFAATRPSPASHPGALLEIRKPWARIVLLVSLLIVTALAAYWRWETRDNRRFQAFWQPWAGANRPVVISVGSNAVYRLSNRLNEQYARDHHLETHGLDFFVPIQPDDKIAGSDITPSPDSFVALGDVAAVSSVVSALTAAHQTYQERFPNDVSFAELRDKATILVGGFNNPMTVELTRALPFVLGARNEIYDSSTGHKWQLHASEDSHDTEDYAIVTRLVRRNGDAPILVLAGMGQYGTLAAAGFICNQATVSTLAQQLPAHWMDRNLQVVLHIRVLDFKPSAVEVVATRVW